MPRDFAFHTAEPLQVQIEVIDLNEQPLAGVKVSVFTGDPDSNGVLMASGFSNNQGLASFQVRCPAYLDEVFVKVNSLGFANTASLPVQAIIQHRFGGTPPPRNKSGKKATLNNPIPAGQNFYYLGSYQSGGSAGLPDYLEPTGDMLSRAFLDDIAASLPEERPVPIHNPQYLTTGNELDVVVLQRSDVWVTFVAEGAGYKNSLAFYTFDSNNPPQSVNNIDSIFFIFPNASLGGSGGQLQAGDKVKIGTFDGGTTISWVLLANGWNDSGVSLNRPTYFSNSSFNNEAEAFKQHTVQLFDVGRQILLNSFEDLPRTTGQSDEDFNDLIFYVSANPWQGIATGNAPLVTASSDDDNDGVSNETDDFPNDPSKAVLNQYSGTLVFEDLWPAQGDYDFNDLVLDYDIDEVLNGANEVVEIDADWTVKAVGGSYNNGFGYQFTDVDLAAVSSVSGQDLQENIVAVAANGLELGQSTAIVILFDDVFNVMPSSGSAFINTIPGANPVPPTTLENKVVFSTPQAQSKVGYPPYNPFIFIDGERGKEVHLADFKSTDWADANYFGTKADAPNAATNYYYKTSNGLPWALDIAQSFQYPVEFEPIDDAYLNFAPWAVSGGSRFSNWYLDLSGYRDNSKIYP